MDFNELCNFFDEIKGTKIKNDKLKLIKECFQVIRNNVQHNSTLNFFDILRLIVPNLDRDRDSYNMKEAKVARILIKMLDLPPGNDKNVLSKCYLMTGQTTDFGEVVFSVIRKYLNNCKTTLSIKELDEGLNSLAKRKSEREAEEIMMNLFKKASPGNIRWIIRIILKDLKLGIGANTILNCYHKDGVAFYASNNNLRKVCEVLTNNNVRLHELDIQIFEAFRPMLSKKIDVANFQRELPDNKLFFVENKFDGERFQMHMKKDEFRYFSRNGFDYTDNLGKSYDSGTLTSKLTDVFHKNVTSLILDGELMLYNRYSKTFGSKGLALDVKKLNKKGPYQPCFCVYDIILLNNEVLTNKPLKERLKTLESVFANLIKGTIELSNVQEVHSRQEIVDALNISVEKDEEGIIIKDSDSIYKYSDRNSGWFKMKLEFFQDVMNDLDLILMGGEHSKITSNKLNSFYVGISSGNAKNGSQLFISIGKVSSGLSYEETVMLDKKLRREGKKFEHFDSDNLLFGKEVPHYYIEPTNSVVFQVRASELVRDSNNSFKTHYTLRFPRILKIRDDKPVDECLSMNEFLELTANNKHVVKLNKRSIELNELLEKKVRRMKKREIEMPTIYDTTKVSDLLEGYNIFVLGENNNFDKERVESLIKKAGGTVIYIPSTKVDILLTSQRTETLVKLIKTRPRYDMVNVSWLDRILQDGNLLGYEQNEVFYIGWNYKNTLADDLDKYGDNFIEETTVEKLKNTFNIVNDMGDRFLTNGTVKLAGKKSFNHYRAYFDKFAEPMNRESGIIFDCFIDEIEYKYYGGKIYENILEDVNLIVYNGDSNRKLSLEALLVSINRSDIEISTKDFIHL